MKKKNLLKKQNLLEVDIHDLEILIPTLRLQLREPKIARFLISLLTNVATIDNTIRQVFLREIRSKKRKRVLKRALADTPNRGNVLRWLSCLFRAFQRAEEHLK